MQFRYQFKTSLIVTHNGKELSIPQGKGIIVNAKDGVDLKPFQILEDYLEYKGYAFQDRLFSIYEECVHNLRMTTNTNIYDFDHDLLYDLLDIMDLQDFTNFVYSLDLTPPEVFEDEFQERQGKDETRTYTISQYIEFIALIHLMSVVSPIMSMLIMYYDKAKKMASIIPFDVMLHHPIMQSDAGVKYMEHTRAIFSKSPKQLLVISRNLTEDEFVSHMACTTLLGKCAIHNIYNDNRKNIITRLHQTLTGKSTPSGLYERSINKVGVEEKIGIFDSVRRHYSITGGVLEEFMFITEDPYLFANQYGKLDGPDGPANKKLLDLALKSIRGVTVSDGVLGLLSAVTMNYINPVAIELLGSRQERAGKGASPIEVVLATGFMLAYKEYPVIAKLFCTNKVSESDGITIKIALMGRIKLKMDDVDRIFPIAKTNGKNYIVEAINMIDEHIAKDRLVSRLPEEYSELEIKVYMDFKTEMLEYFKWCNDRNDARIML